LLTSFGEYLTVDLQLRETTATLHILKVRQFLEYLGSDALDVRVCDIRAYLNTLRKTPCDYKNALSALKRFYRDYLDAPDLVESFEFPKKPLQPKIIPTKKELNRFYKVLKSVRDRAIFLLYA